MEKIYHIKNSLEELFEQARLGPSDFNCTQVLDDRLRIIHLGYPPVLYDGDHSDLCCQMRHDLNNIYLGDVIIRLFTNRREHRLVFHVHFSKTVTCLLRKRINIVPEKGPNIWNTWETEKGFRLYMNSIIDDIEDYQEI